LTIYLLDINLLLALTDPMHVHHKIAHEWFVKTGQKAWATCPLTQNGFVRIASHPKYPNRPGDVRAVCSILGQICESPGHHFWAEALSLLDILDSDAIISHAQITDIYLLGLAVHKRGKLSTLDQHIPVGAVRGGRRALELINAPQ
jgi:toxin-antitoxin system PIN domain toxin